MLLGVFLVVGTSSCTKEERLATNDLMVKTTGHWENWYWNGNLDDLCTETTPENCAVYIYDNDVTYDAGLDEAIDNETLSTYLYTTAGLEVPLTSGERTDLANGTMSFYPKSDGSGGTHYRWE